MAVHSGQAGEALESARAALAARDRDLAGADAALAAVVAAAHAAATEAIRRIEAMRADIDAAVAAHPDESPAQARELARFLLGKQRQLAELVTETKAEAAAKTAALQALLHCYQG